MPKRSWRRTKIGLGEGPELSVLRLGFFDRPATEKLIGEDVDSDYLAIVNATVRNADDSPGTPPWNHFFCLTISKTTTSRPR
jgi:hypothetical protein